MAEITDEHRGLGAQTRADNRSSLSQKTTSGNGPSERRVRTFSSPSDAARDAIRMYNPRSIRENREYGGTIYRLPGSTKFSYVTPPNIQPSERTTGSVSTAQQLPTGAVEAGRWHTHGKTENFTDEEFSQTDLMLAYARKIPSWLGTPKGAIKVAVPTKSGVVIIDDEPTEQTRPNIRFQPF